MKHKKTILITTPYFPPHSGGLERYVYEVGSRLNKREKWNVVILTSGEKNGKDVVEEVDGLTIYKLGYSLKVSNTPFSFSWLYKIRRIINEVNPDVINIHTPVPGIGDIALFYAGRRPVVVTYHAGSMRKGILIPDLLIWVYEHGPLQFLLRRADRITCSSDFVRNGLLKKFQAKSSTITPAVDLDLFTPASDQKEKQPTILFVASLGVAEQYKGLKTLIDAIEIVKRTIPDVKLTVVGDGDMREVYHERVVEKGLQENVIFKGKLLGEELVREYQRAHLFVLPTSNDSSPMVITEAFATELPVVSTTVGGIPDMVDEGVTGFLVSPNDAEHLAERIETLLEDTELIVAFGKAGREKMIRDYSWDDRIQKYDVLFDEVLIKAQPAVIQVSAYFPPHLGGIEQVVENVSRRLSEAGRNVIVLTTREKGSPSVERGKNLTIKRIARFELAHVPIAPTLLWHLCLIPKNSIIHFHLAPAYWPEVVLCLAKVRRIPYIAHFHLDVEPSSIFGVLFSVYKKIVWGPFLRNAEKVIVCSEEQIGIVTNKYGVLPNRVSVIPNAVQEDFFSDRVYTQPTEELKLLYVGRLAVQKRVERLVETMEHLQIPAHLTIVGGGNLREELELLVQSKQLTSITFVGEQNHTQIKEYYHTHDALLISSDREGLPLVVIEAMASGLPVIGTNVIGIRKLLEGVGITVDEPYGENFASVITGLWKTPHEFERLSKLSREKASHFTWGAFMQNLDRVYGSTNI